jgi:hypothetical protein
VMRRLSPLQFTPCQSCSLLQRDRVSFCLFQILNVFDLLDPEERGTIGFVEFYYLALLLMAIHEV